MNTRMKRLTERQKGEKVDEEGEGEKKLSSGNKEEEYEIKRLTARQKGEKSDEEDE